jgi:ADP-ribosylglycohydrolase
MVVDVFDRVYGCLIGGAIGDALGAPVENWHYTDIRQQHGRITSFLPQPGRRRDGQPGQITDDSTLRHYLCRAIIDTGGRVGPEEYARVWLDRLNPDRLFVTERLVLEKLRLGMSPWDTGRGQLLADAAIMSIAPVGIINAGDPRQAYADAVLVAGLHQDGIERDAAATLAAGIASCFLPDPTLASVVDAMRANATYEVRRLLDDARKLAAQATNADDLVKSFYQTLLDRTFPSPPGETWDAQRSVAATSREVLPAAVALLLAHGDDPNQALIEAASFGRDTDTIASVVGCLVGAYHGAAALNPAWIEDCERANTAFFTEADRTDGTNFATTAAALVDALHRVHDHHVTRTQQIATLLRGSSSSNNGAPSR